MTTQLTNEQYLQLLGQKEVQIQSAQLTILEYERKVEEQAQSITKLGEEIDDLKHKLRVEGSNGK